LRVTKRTTPLLALTSIVAVAAVSAIVVAPLGAAPVAPAAGALNADGAHYVVASAEADRRARAAYDKVATAKKVHREAIARKSAIHRNRVAREHSLHLARIAAAKKAAADRAAAKVAARHKVAVHRASRSSVRSIAPSHGSNRSIGKALAAARGWTGVQWTCLNNLWTSESGWSSHSGSTGGAYGIPQALPGSKMASEGSDWRTNPATQIKWGLKYIEGRYNSPCGAWSHSESTGWY